MGLIHTPYVLCRWRGATRNVGSEEERNIGRWSDVPRTIDRDHRTCINSMDYNGCGRMWRGGITHVGSTVQQINASIPWARRPPIVIKGTCLIRGVITVQIKSRGRHLDCRIKNQGARSKSFYKAFHRIKLWSSIMIRRSRLNLNGQRWTVSS